MSKYIKQLITDHLRQEWVDLEFALLVSVNGMNANANVRLRRELRDLDIRLLVVKNSLARRASVDSPLALALDGVKTPSAVVWGGEDIVSLAKEVVRLSKIDEYAPFSPTGGVMEGERLSMEQVIELSKWPSRKEQLSILVAQILSPGASLSSQLLAPGSALASQIEQKGESEGEPEEENSSMANPSAASEEEVSVQEEQPQESKPET